YGSSFTLRWSVGCCTWKGTGSYRARAATRTARGPRRRLCGERGTLKLDRDPALERPVQVRVDAQQRGSGAAHVHVELHHPLSGEVEEDVQVLRQHDLQALILEAGRHLPGRLHRRQVLRQVVEGDQKAGRRRLEARVERGDRVAHLVLVRPPGGGEELTAAAPREARLERRDDLRRRMVGEREAHLGEAVAAHEVEALEAVEEVLAEVE